MLTTVMTIIDIAAGACRTAPIEGRDRRALTVEIDDQASVCSAISYGVIELDSQGPEGLDSYDQVGVKRSYDGPGRLLRTILH